MSQNTQRHMVMPASPTPHLVVAHADQLLKVDKLRLSYALRGARDNPWMESFNSRFKAEGHSLFLEAQDLAELTEVIDWRMTYYNTDRRHSTLSYVAPMVFIRQQEMSHALPA